MLRFAALALAIAPCVVLSAPAAYDAGSRAFVDAMVRKYELDHAEVAALMAGARYQQDIIDAMNRPFEAKPWYRYRRLFLTPERIAGGRAFLREHAALLLRAEARYGVPPEIIVAIIGIETNYGRRVGDHRVIDALSTLGFAYPKRAAFFRSELEELLLLAREERVDAGSVRGSYAGAVGKPQFIPSSYRAYAVDFDGDGRRDLWGSDADVVGSVANYLARHGWRGGEPVAAPATAGRPLPGAIAIANKQPLQPGITVETLREAGIETDPDVAGTMRAALIALHGPDDTRELWLGFDNFYAITRYNHSNLYAMAVYQLSREITKPGRQRG